MAESDNPDFLPTQPWAGNGDVPTIPATPPQAHPPASPGDNPRRGGWQPPTPDELQPSFPQYEIRRVLGRGGMGAVYQGWQKSLDRSVAIKILPPQLEDTDVNFGERFKREAKAMARFAHPGIVSVYDAGETPEGLLYFIMEYIEGTDVQKMVAAQGHLSPENALTITAHVCDALAYAHRRGVIHRDIKPSNVMVDAEGQVKVADFGLAKVASDDSAALLTGTHLSMGTPDFMAPETMMGMRKVDHRADLYAVGVMLYQMLTGQLPRGRFAPPSRRIPGLDVRFDAIVDHALQNDPEHRYSTATEIRTDLERIRNEPARHVAVVPPPEEPPPAIAGQLPDQTPTKPLPLPETSEASSPKTPRKNRGLIYAGVALAMGTAFFIISYFGRSKIQDGGGPTSFPDPLTSRSHLPEAIVITPPPTVPPKPTPPPQKPIPSILPEPANRLEEILVQGKQLRERGDFASAITRFREAATLDPKNPQSLTELAVTYEKMGLADKAGEQWRKIYEMGDAASIYFSLAAAKLKDTQADARQNAVSRPPTTPPDPTAAIDGIAAGSTLGLLPVTPEDMRDDNSAKRLTLHIPIKARPKAHVDVRDLVIHVLFYDIVDGQNVVQTSANVNSRWATPPADWADSDTEELAVEYQLQKPEARAAKRENRKYFGYIVRIYYKQQLQAAAAEPERLAQQYPPPAALPAATQDDSAGFGKYAMQLRKTAITSMEPQVVVVQAALGIPAAPAATISSTTAIRDTPFVNTLGMKFVPVPITGGKALLFSIWETRVQDYQAFIKATRRVWEKPPFTQGPTHPAVRVSWSEATAFCEWLTKREHESRTLSAEARYRLPTDLEWSWAVGLDVEYGDTPALRDSAAPGYPWGDTWPPPHNAGNYDPSLHTDSFPYTSPVGSFPPNRHGLFDLGGNAFEWVEDYFDQTHTTRTVRGASWADGTDAVMSSTRFSSKANVHFKSYGFRCVLENPKAPNLP